MGKDVIINENFDKIDKAIWPSIKDAGINTPPETKIDGEGYIIGTNPSGEWIGRDNNVGIYRNTSRWDYYVPVAGMMFFVINKGAVFVFDGNSWVKKEISSSAGTSPEFLGIGFDASLDTRLGVKSKGVVFEGDPGVVLKINKEGSGDVGCVAFGSSEVSKVEIGLMGDCLLYTSDAADDM
jgi:hypothetical protein